MPCSRPAASRPKGQTTIPREVRQKLSLRPGDVLIYELDEDAVRVRKQAPLDVGYLRAVQTTLSEWDSPEDAAAFDDL
jgi:antitoxin PrlF